jgi:hypothetical protein
VNDGHGPHLTLDEASLLDDAVLHAFEGDLMGSTEEIIRSINIVIPSKRRVQVSLLSLTSPWFLPFGHVPHLTIAIERAVAKAVPVDILATKDPSGRLILKSDGQ